MSFARSAAQAIFRFGLLGLTILILSTGAASAQTDTLDVSATVVAATPTCSTGIQSVDFGNIDAGDTVTINDINDSFDMNFNCTGAVTGATATFDGGLNPSSVVFRRLTGPGGATISYDLTVAIGGILTVDLPNGISSISLNGTIRTQTITSTLGAFSDTVTVSYTF